jgi:hypothetical protein
MERTKIRPPTGPLSDKEGNTDTETKEMSHLLNKAFNEIFTREGSGFVPGPTKRE